LHFIHFVAGAAPLRGNFILAMTKEKSLYLLSPDGQVEKKLGDNIRAFSFYENTLFILQEDTRNAFRLYTRAFDTEQRRELFAAEESIREAELDAVGGSEAILLLNGRLLRIDEKGQDVLATDVNEFNLVQENSLLFYLSNQEFWMHDFNRRLRAQLIRQNRSAFLPLHARKMQAIIAMEEHTITAVELDGRDKRQRFLLHELPNISQFEINSAGDALYILESGGLVTIPLQ
jgi:hypothetical protein